MEKTFNEGACFSRPNVLGLNDKVMAKQLQVDVSFFPFKIVANDITVFVASIGKFRSRRVGFCRSWISICQSITDMGCQIDIYFRGEIVCTHSGKTLDDVWNKLDILKKYNGKELFGLSDLTVIQEIQNYINTPFCMLTD